MDGKILCNVNMNRNRDVRMGVMNYFLSQCRHLFFFMKWHPYIPFTIIPLVPFFQAGPNRNENS